MVRAHEQPRRVPMARPAEISLTVISRWLEEYRPFADQGAADRARPGKDVVGHPGECDQQLPEQGEACTEQGESEKYHLFIIT